MALSASHCLQLFFLEINALVHWASDYAFILHEATAMWDVSYAVMARNVTPLEQHVHRLLEMIPLMALLLIVPLKWPQFLALFRSLISHPFSYHPSCRLLALFGRAGTRFTREQRPVCTAPRQAKQL
jgi:hypothetical protein